MNRAFRRTTTPLSALFPVLLILSACGGDDGDGNQADAATGGDGGGQADAPTGADANIAGFTTLIESQWTLGAQTEDYQCERLTVTSDIYIAEFRSIAPEGTHHTVLTVGDPDGPDGTSNCDAGTNADAMIYGSGVGPAPLALPPGVAMKVSAGQQLLINLHLFNTSDSEISGTSGTLIKAIPVGEVVHEAEVVLAGKAFSLMVPPGPSTQTGTCNMNGDVTIFAIGPHMHQLGTHMMVETQSQTAGNVTLHDGAYDFFEQKIYPIAPIELKNLDSVQVHCSYVNGTGATVGFGDSSNQEMCFAGLYRYPARGGDVGIFCTGL